MSTAQIPELEEARELVERAMKLSPAIRQEIAIELYESVAPLPAQSDPVRDFWKTEIARRIEDIKAGKSKLHDAKEVVDELREHLRRRRSS